MVSRITEENRKERGITLITLLVAIVVLLILAGISIQMLTGENGLINKALDAKEEAKRAEIEKLVEVEALSSYENGDTFNWERFKEKIPNDLVIEEDSMTDLDEDERVKQGVFFLTEDYKVTVEEEYDGDIKVTVEKYTGTGEMEVTLESGEVVDKKVKLSTKIKNKPMGNITYDFYIGDQKIKSQTDKDYEYATTFGKVIAYVEVTDKDGRKAKSNEVTIKDNTIKTYEELQKFRDTVNSGTTYEGEEIIQVADIDMRNEDWTPIAPFRGTYDGQKHIISNLNINTTVAHAGLFEEINANAIVKNLTIKNSSCISTSPNTIMGLAVGYNRGTVENVTVEESTVENGKYIGGVVGGNVNGKIESCTNKGKVTNNTVAASGTGGVVGGFMSGTISNCTNEGEVTASVGMTGGISGSSQGDFTNCLNKGKITGLGEKAAGITGNLVNGTLKECTNEGSIIGAGEIGGIAGVVQSGLMQLCVNKGDVSVDSSLVVAKYDDMTSGGMIGTVFAGGRQFQIEKCKNEGTISSSWYASGIIAECNGNAIISECVNKGSIIFKAGVPFDSFNIGGIVASAGYGTDPEKIINCYNTGKIDFRESSAVVDSGNIVGRTWDSDVGSVVKIENCYGIGTMMKAQEQKLNEGGIVGLDANTELKNNYWLNSIGVEYGRGQSKQNEGAESKTSAELKGLAETLGSAFREDTNNINSGYPILAWENE